MAQFYTTFPNYCKVQLSYWNNKCILSLHRPDKLKEVFAIGCQRSSLNLRWVRVTRTSKQHTVSACGSNLFNTPEKLPTYCCCTQLPLLRGSSLQGLRGIKNSVGPFPILLLGCLNRHPKRRCSKMYEIHVLQTALQCSGPPLDVDS